MKMVKGGETYAFSYKTLCCLKRASIAGDGMFIKWQVFLLTVSIFFV